MTELALPAEALLAHADFLRRLARGLTDRDSEDVAQETWLRALRRPPRDQRSPREWLAAVAGNVLRNRRRAEARRTATERTAARECPVPSPQEIALREEVRARVVAAVLELPPALYAVVWLRYWEGLDSKAIGVRLQRPAGTVRWQLHDALERLRRRLDHEHGERRAAWAAPLAAWCRGAGGALASPLRVVAVALAGVLLCGGAWLALGPASAPDPAAGTPGASALAPEPAAEPSASEPRRRPALAAALPVQREASGTRYAGERPSVVVVVVVIDEDSRAAQADVAVGLRSVADAQPAALPACDEREVERRARTDGTGVARFADLPAGDYEAEARDARGRVAGRRFAAGSGTTSCTLALARADWRRGLVAVKVADAAGLGVAGAEVTVLATTTRHDAVAWDHILTLEGRTDARGGLRLSDADRLELMYEGRVVARTADGRVGATALGRPEHRGYSPAVRVVVDVPGGIEGRLCGVPDRDWSTALVHARPALAYDHVPAAYAAETLTAVPSPHGAFRFDGLPPGRYQLALAQAPLVALVREERSPGEAELPVVKVVAGRTAVAELRVAPAACLRGRVLDAAAAPIAGATVAVRAHEAWAGQEVVRWALSGDDPRGTPEQASAATDADGRYALTDLVAGTWDVVVTAPGQALDARAALVLEAGATRELEHRLVAGEGALRGIGPPGTGVALRGPEPSPIHLLFADGAFALGGLAPGKYAVGLWTHDPPALVPVETVDIAAGCAAWVDLRGGGARSVRGRVLANGAPVPDLDVACGHHRTRTASDGSFVVEVARADPSSWCGLELAWRGCALARCALGDLLPGQHELGAVAIAAQPLELRLLDARAQPAPGSIELCPNHDTRARLPAPAGVAFAWVPPGRLEVSAHFADGTSVREMVSVGAATPATLTLQQRPAGAIEVSVVDADGAPVVDRRVEALEWGRTEAAPAGGAAFAAERDPSDAPCGAQTDDQGRARIVGLRPGPVLVYFAGGPWATHRYQRGGIESLDLGPPPAERIVLVCAGETVAVQLALPR